MRSKYSENNSLKTITRLALFLILTFTLSWGFDRLIFESGGIEALRDSGGISPGMLVPAFVALALRIYIFRDNKLHYKNLRDKSRWIFYSFFILFFIIIILNILALKYPDFSTVFIGTGTGFIAFWTLSIFFILGLSSAKAFRRAGLNIENIGKGIPFIIGIALYFLLSALLNLIFGLGDLQPRSPSIYSIPADHPFYIPLLILLFIAVALIGGPLSSLALYFGEEYGWRGFLQNELFRYNKRIGAAIIGLIWGAWHIPLILKGLHTYPATTEGIMAALIFFTLWGIILSYSVLKTGSILVAAFMHGSVNYIYSFSITYIVHPYVNLKSFGLGVYGLIILLVIVIIVLFNPAWEKN